MEKINTLAELKAAIAELEVRQDQQSMQIRYQADLAIESLKPANLIKSAFSKSSGPVTITGSLLSNSLGLSAGYVAKRLIEVTMRRPLSRLVGTAVMFGIQRIVSSNPDTIRKIGAGVFSLIRRKSRENQTESGQNS
jgi:hypothetical protein